MRRSRRSQCGRDLTGRCLLLGRALINRARHVGSYRRRSTRRRKRSAVHQDSLLRPLPLPHPLTVRTRSPTSPSASTHSQGRSPRRAHHDDGDVQRRRKLRSGDALTPRSVPSTSLPRVASSRPARRSSMPSSPGYGWPWPMAREESSSDSSLARRARGRGEAWRRPLAAPDYQIPRFAPRERRRPSLALGSSERRTSPSRRACRRA